MNSVPMMSQEMVDFLAQGNAKPVVHYTPNPNQYIPDVVGKGAMVWPVNHTNHLFSQNVSNDKCCFTSAVIRIGEKGEFETLNTIYKPVVSETAGKLNTIIQYD